MASIYLAMGLTQAPAEFREEFDIHFRNQLRQAGYELLDFVGLSAGDAVSVYQHDLACVDKADLVVAICDHPSIGLGMEIARRIAIRKQLLLAWHTSARVTRMLIGCAEVERHVYTCRYTTQSEITQAIGRLQPAIV